MSASQRRFWDDNGFLPLVGHFPTVVVDGLNRLLDDLWANARAQRRPTVADIYVGTSRERRVLLSDAPREAQRHPYKINDLYLESDDLRRIILEPRLSAVIEELLSGPPLVCNTLNLEYGSQQEFHNDSLYMAAPVGRYLVASWIALEDARPDAGLLQYYPGSHQIPPYLFSQGTTHAIEAEMPQFRAYMDDEIARRGLKIEQFHGRAGDVVIWHSQLYHGGDAIRNPTLTRRSLVTHYWRAWDMPGPHPAVGEGSYYLARAPQPVP